MEQLLPRREANQYIQQVLKKIRELLGADEREMPITYNDAKVPNEWYLRFGGSRGNIFAFMHAPVSADGNDVNTVAFCRVDHSHYRVTCDTIMHAKELEDLGHIGAYMFNNYIAFSTKKLNNVTD